MKKRVFWAAIVLAVSIWQVYAGFERCGAIDGGVLLAPLIAATYMLIKGMTEDLKKAFGREGNPWQERA